MKRILLATLLNNAERNYLVNYLRERSIDVEVEEDSAIMVLDSQLATAQALRNDSYRERVAGLDRTSASLGRRSGAIYEL